jgi:hypothetical protein
LNASEHWFVDGVTPWLDVILDGEQLWIQSADLSNANFGRGVTKKGRHVKEIVVTRSPSSVSVMSRASARSLCYAMFGLTVVIVMVWVLLVSIFIYVDRFGCGFPHFPHFATLCQTSGSCL